MVFQTELMKLKLNYVYFGFLNKTLNIQVIEELYYFEKNLNEYSENSIIYFCLRIYYWHENLIGVRVILS